MRKIAIVLTNGHDCEYDSYGTIIQSITEWTDVSEEEYEILTKAQRKRYAFVVLEQPKEPRKFVAKTVADYLLEEERLAAAAILEKERRAEAALARKHKKDLKDRDSKLALLKKLQEELGA